VVEAVYFSGTESLNKSLLSRRPVTQTDHAESERREKEKRNVAQQKNCCANVPFDLTSLQTPEGVCKRPAKRLFAALRRYCRSVFGLLRSSTCGAIATVCRCCCGGANGAICALYMTRGASFMLERTRWAWRVFRALRTLE
jgi:hypothetical protein